MSTQNSKYAQNATEADVWIVPCSNDSRYAVEIDLMLIEPSIMDQRGV